MNLRKDRGITILMVLILIVILTFIGGVLVWIVNLNIKSAGALRRQKISFYYAEAGINHAISILKNTYGVDENENFTPLLLTAYNMGWAQVNDEGEVDGNGDWYLIPELSNFSFREGSYRVYLRDDQDDNPENPFEDQNRVILVRSLGNGPGDSKTLIEVELELVP